MMGRKELEK